MFMYSNFISAEPGRKQEWKQQRIHPAYDGVAEDDGSLLIECSGIHSDEDGIAEDLESRTYSPHVRVAEDKFLS
jgi:hypothetical protein